MPPYSREDRCAGNTCNWLNICTFGSAGKLTLTPEHNVGCKSRLAHRNITSRALYSSKNKSICKCCVGVRAADLSWWLIFSGLLYLVKTKETKYLNLAQFFFLSSEQTHLISRYNYYSSIVYSTLVFHTSSTD